MTDRSLPRLSRRQWLTLSAAGVLGPSVSGWLAPLARVATAAGPPVAPRAPRRARSCILLWMSGGPSQTDTFDLKPGHKNGGPFKEIETSAPGLRISEHLPRLAKFGHRLGVIRSMTSKEGDHGRGAYLLHTGYLPQAGVVEHPALGSLLAKEKTPDGLTLPPYVSIAPFRQFNPAAYESGLLGPDYAPLFLADSNGAAAPPNVDDLLKVQDLAPSAKTDSRHADARIDLLRDLDRTFADERPDTPPRSHKAAYERGIRLMRSKAGRAFHLKDEKARVRDAYGRNLFGQGCLLARRLVECGVPFVEVNLAGVNGGGFGWDTHAQNFETVKQLSEVLDKGWSALMDDLADRGLLDTTLIVWMGEFGRTPQINGNAGRDHYPNAWATVLAGGGIVGGQAVGKTGADGMEVKDRPVTVPDLIATVCKAMDVDPEKQNVAPNGRPIRLADKSAKPIAELLG